MSRRSVALLTRELATLVKAELPVDEALRIARLQPLLPARSQQVIARVLDRVVEGASLSEALGHEATTFPAYYARVVQAGEAAGTLGQSLDELAGFLERESEFRARIGSALLYPALLLIAAAGALLVIMTVLIPTVAPLFRDAGAQPPFIIQLLLDVQETIAAHWLLALVAAGAIAGGYIALARNGLATWRDRQRCTLPPVAPDPETPPDRHMMRTLARSPQRCRCCRLADFGDVLSNRAMAAAVRTPPAR
jgi:general secretion pathway protein F